MFRLLWVIRLNNIVTILWKNIHIIWRFAIKFMNFGYTLCELWILNVYVRNIRVDEIWLYEFITLRFWGKSSCLDGGHYRKFYSYGHSSDYRYCYVICHHGVVMKGTINCTENINNNSDKNGDNSNYAITRKILMTMAHNGINTTRLTKQR